jgi:23S rRNA (cytosine1962-C5)-methyltransferase
MMGEVILQAHKVRPLVQGHPWVFAGAIQQVRGLPADGEVVRVLSPSGQFIAYGLYNSRSKIRVRLYSWDPTAYLDRDFFRQRLEQAVRLRHQRLQCNTPEGGCRLVFSEADFLSGLIVDRYGPWLTMQLSALGLAQRREWLVELLRQLVPCQGIYLRSEKGIGRLEGMDLQDGLLWGEMPPEELIIVENGLQFIVDILRGQKTGFYLDQRENRQRVATWCAGQRVLDAFCYSGGFGLYAARHGATEVVGIDSSTSAITLAQRNAELNGLSRRIRFECADVFDRLAALVQAGERFDMVILDPPRFAHSRTTVPEALRGYRRLYQLALRLLTPEGLLVACCCTGVILREELEEVLAQAAAKARRAVHILERRGPAPDHPIALACRETGYLKCLICRVI